MRDSCYFLAHIDICFKMAFRLHWVNSYRVTAHNLEFNFFKHGQARSKQLNFGKDRRRIMPSFDRHNVF